jgi:hypothetical protein
MSTDGAADLTDGLEDQSYEFKDELKIRKVLERRTDWQFEFTKNDQYEYDLRILEWDDEPQSPADNRVLGYVELERARKDRPTSWVTGDVPDSWHYYSFLMRKIRKWDYDAGNWAGLKDDYRRTVYLKFNHALDNCFAAPVKDIYEQGERTKRSDGGRQNTYLKLGFDDPTVRVGISDCVDYIEEYLSRSDPGQTGLLEWSD